MSAIDKQVETGQAPISTQTYPSEKHATRKREPPRKGVVHGAVVFSGESTKGGCVSYIDLAVCRTGLVAVRRTVRWYRWWVRRTASWAMRRWSSGWSVGRSAGWSVCRTVGWTGWAARRIVRRMVRRMVRRAAGWGVRRTSWALRRAAGWGGGRAGWAVRWSECWAVRPFPFMNREAVLAMEADLPVFAHVAFNQDNGPVLWHMSKPAGQLVVR